MKKQLILGVITLMLTVGAAVDNGRDREWTIEQSEASLEQQKQMLEQRHEWLKLVKEERT